jgi:DNA polymerase III delta subunit
VSKGRAKGVPLNIFYGSEDYLVDRAKEKATAWPDREITTLDGNDVSEDDVISAMDQMTLGDGGISVVLDNAEKVKLTAAFTEYLSSRPAGDTSSVLTALIRSDKIPKAWVEAAVRGRLVQYEKCKPWDEKGISSKVDAEAKLLGIKLGDGAFATLYKVYAEDVAGMANELRKLVFIVGKGGVVTKDHILSVCSRQIPVMPWDISEAACQKAKRKALTLTGLLFKYEGEGASVPIVASMQKSVERLLIACSLEAKGYAGKDVASALGLNPYIYEKNYAPMVKRHTVEGLRTQMKKLCELETRIKGPAPSKRTLVELAVLSLAE